MGCGAFLASPTWVAIRAAVFCRCCSHRDHENCVHLLPLLDSPYWYGIVQEQAGLYFLAPYDQRFRGHSLWRIWQARAAEERGDNEAAAWFLQGQKIVEGPEHCHNTPLPIVNVQRDGLPITIPNTPEQQARQYEFDHRPESGPDAPLSEAQFDG